MNKEYINLRKNIICLREAYGETQSDLALAIGLNGPSAIGNYETGKNIPIRDVIIKIANHYRITVDELLNGDFTGYDFKSLPLDDMDKNLIIVNKMLPLISSKKAMQDSYFKKGYEIHIKIYESLKKEDTSEFDEFEECFEYYENSFMKNKTIEAAANIIWWLYYIGFYFYFEDEALEAITKLNKNEISKQDFLKYHFLNNNEGIEDFTNKKTERKQYVDSIEDALKECLTALKESDELSDLADFYLAMRYYLYLVNNDRSDAINRTIGEEMLSSFAEVGNKYAQNLLLGYE